jgi:hypothetical protein
MELYMKKPVYKHPECVIETSEKRIEEKNKRLWLSLIIDKTKNENILVILKNPSRATKDISDKTVFTVTNYIYKNRNKFKELKNAGTVTILNLIPFYETYSDKLANSEVNIIDAENLKAISSLTSKNKKVIIAWGDHPKGLKEQFTELKNSVMNILKKNNNDIFFVDKLTIKGNPKHGQVWGYNNPLIKYRLTE